MHSAPARIVVVVCVKATASPTQDVKKNYVNHLKCDVFIWLHIYVSQHHEILASSKNSKIICSNADLSPYNNHYTGVPPVNIISIAWAYMDKDYCKSHVIYKIIRNKELQSVCVCIEVITTAVAALV